MIKELKTCCGKCQRKLRMLTSHAGRKVKCPCGSILEVPVLAAVQRALPERFVCEPVTVDGLQVSHPTDRISRRLQRAGFDDSLILRSLAQFESTDGEEEEEQEDEVAKLE